jgi:cardiolipin synthase
MHWSLLYLASEWAIRLVMLVYVPQRRTPAQARTWLLLIFLLPIPGLVLYALFGRIRISRKRIEERERLSAQVLTWQAQRREKLREALAAVESDAGPTLTLARKLGDFEPRAGNTVELLTDYRGSIERIVKDIDAARHHVHLLYYIFADDETGRLVLDALGRAVKRGVECRLLVDGLGSGAYVKRVKRACAELGVRFAVALPVGLWGLDRSRFDLRNHRKIAVIDGEIGYVGSQNVVDANFKKGIVYKELVARVHGLTVRALQALFVVDYHSETGETFDVPTYAPNFESRGNVVAQVLPSGPGYAHENNERLIVSLFYEAKRRAVLTAPYFVPDEPLVKAIQTAALRGVDTHLVVSRVMDQFSVGLSQRSFYDDLLAAGVKIHLYGPEFLHAKHFSCDDSVCWIGSSNFDIRSFALNAEVTILVYDPATAASLAAIEEAYFRGSTLLTLEEWRKRPRWVQLAENVARLGDSFL